MRWSDSAFAAPHAGATVEKRYLNDRGCGKLELSGTAPVEQPRDTDPRPRPIMWCAGEGGTKPEYRGTSIEVVKVQNTAQKRG